jgi:hypothetical protein
VLCFTWFLLIALTLMQIPARDSVRNRVPEMGSVTRLTVVPFRSSPSQGNDKNLGRSDGQNILGPAN